MHITLAHLVTRRLLLLTHWCITCWSVGALFHLSFLDEAKAQVGASVRLELLVKLSGQTQVSVYTWGGRWGRGVAGV
jgi:hypothetical protein